MRKPDFIIVGTQKAGTSWLRYNLSRHPKISGPKKQIHFFDRNHDNGMKWYSNHFEKFPNGLLVGEKSTEYFDTLTASPVAERIANDCPDARIIVVLREPVSRAFSALKHTVIAGLEPLPKDHDALLFEDHQRSLKDGFRYIERGFYAQQIKAYLDHIPKDRLLVLTFEEDIIQNPDQGISKAYAFLGVDSCVVQADSNPINVRRRLSQPGIRMMNKFATVPYARSLIWRLDLRLPLKPWNPQFSKETTERLREIYAKPNEELYELLGRRISAWD